MINSIKPLLKVLKWKKFVLIQFINYFLIFLFEFVLLYLEISNKPASLIEELFNLKFELFLISLPIIFAMLSVKYYSSVQFIKENQISIQYLSNLNLDLRSLKSNIIKIKIIVEVLIIFLLTIFWRLFSIIFEIKSHFFDILKICIPIISLILIADIFLFNLVLGEFLEDMFDLDEEDIHFDFELEEIEEKLNEKKKKIKSFMIFIYLLIPFVFTYYFNITAVKTWNYELVYIILIGISLSLSFILPLVIGRLLSSNISRIILFFQNILVKLKITPAINQVYKKITNKESNFRKTSIVLIIFIVNCFFLSTYFYDFHNTASKEIFNLNWDSTEALIELNSNNVSKFDELNGDLEFQGLKNYQTLYKTNIFQKEGNQYGFTSYHILLTNFSNYINFVDYENIKFSDIIGDLTSFEEIFELLDSQNSSIIISHSFAKSKNLKTGDEIRFYTDSHIENNNSSLNYEIIGIIDFAPLLRIDQAQSTYETIHLITSINKTYFNLHERNRNSFQILNSQVFIKDNYSHMTDDYTNYLESKYSDIIEDITLKADAKPIIQITFLDKYLRYESYLLGFVSFFVIFFITREIIESRENLRKKLFFYALDERTWSRLISKEIYIFFIIVLSFAFILGVIFSFLLFNLNKIILFKQIDTSYYGGLNQFFNQLNSSNGWNLDILMPFVDITFRINAFLILIPISFIIFVKIILAINFKKKGDK